ncbi:MAG: PilN domain-containing protein [Deltaproteobacteria bacterium]
MIEINLLPQELRIKRNKTAVIEPKYFFYLIPFAFGLLITVQVWLLLVTVFRSYELSALNARWEKLSPQRKELDDLKQQYDAVSQDANITKQLIVKRINWAEKLNKLSLNLPSGVWFNEISVSPKEFVLKGAAVSVQKNEMTLINQFIESLKRDAAFLKDFNNLELTSFQVRSIGGYDAVEFILTAGITK